MSPRGAGEEPVAASHGSASRSRTPVKEEPVKKERTETEEDPWFGARKGEKEEELVKEEDRDI